MIVAALYVQRGGAYWDLPGVDPWDEARDARLYAGPWPVVAHPPCSRWCQLARVNEVRWGAKVGDDGGCFVAALEAVHAWGGVLEHPAYSMAWDAFGLVRPRAGEWTPDMFNGGWVTQVAQRAYGHPARKRTWLFYRGPTPPALDWSEPAPLAWVGNDGSKNAKRQLGKKEAAATPPAFRELLLSLARNASRVKGAA